MTSRVLDSLLLCVCLCTPVVRAAAQEDSAPKRPRLEVGSDTNDARGYFDLGLRLIERKPAEAATAFYWALRLDPGMSDAFHARRAALLMSDDSPRTGRAPSARQLSRALQLDSLEFRAMMLNPFLYRRLDLAQLRSAMRKSLAGRGRASATDVEQMIEGVLQASPVSRALVAYSEGGFDRALSHYVDAMRLTKTSAGLRIARARIFGMRGEPDSAIAEFQRALVELRSRETKEIVVLYNSKAVVEQSIGMMLEQKSDSAGARAAYGRALQEDLAYWPAHMRLGLLSMAAHDTASAATEFLLAKDIASSEPYVHAMVGALLAQIGRPKEGLAMLRRANELEPLYALPHLQAARMYEQAGFDEEAIGELRAFLAKASRSDPQRSEAESRLAALKVSGGTS